MSLYLCFAYTVQSTLPFLLPPFSIFVVTVMFQLQRQCFRETAQRTTLMNRQEIGYSIADRKCASVKLNQSANFVI